MSQTTPANYSHRLFDGFDPLNLQEWAKIVPRSDLPMDPRLIGVIQRTLADQFKFWTLMVYDQRQAIAACAALCLFRIDALASAPAPLRKMGAMIRRVRPNFMNFGVLFCGLPIPPAQSSLRVAPDADRAAVVRVIDVVMRQLARRERALLTVFKEFGAQQQQQLGVLTDLGYIRGDIPPMHHFEARFANFDAYQNALKSRYRAQIRRSIRKFEEAGFKARRVHGAAAILEVYTEKLHDLYLQVWQHSKYRLEKLPADFFRELARAFPDAVALTLLERDGQIAAFTFSLAPGDVYHNLYSGLDYRLNADGDLYFNLFYNDLDAAFQTGASDIELGQTSDEFKARLGSIPHPLHFFTRARNPIIHRILRLFSRRIFPAVPAVETHLVYKEEPPPAPRHSKQQISCSPPTR